MKSAAAFVRAGAAGAAWAGAVALSSAAAQAAAVTYVVLRKRGTPEKCVVPGRMSASGPILVLELTSGGARWLV
ncbi:hypothetical protein GCM10010252_48980 [Streptomyces aureoverticillatus]|nr:hypothetical protein GCM10010252_48980 [Streptomyces aureoverticillatus]